MPCVTRREFKPGLVTAGFLATASFLSPAVAFEQRRPSVKLTFHSKCINLPSLSLSLSLFLFLYITYCTLLAHRYALSRNSHWRFWRHRLLRLFQDCPCKGYFVTLQCCIFIKLRPVSGKYCFGNIVWDSLNDCNSVFGSTKFLTIFSNFSTLNWKGKRWRTEKRKLRNVSQLLGWY